MNKTIILDFLRENKSQFEEQFGIQKMALFGSYARGEETENSDVDIVIVEAKERVLRNRLNAKAILENAFGKNVDIGYLDSMKTFIQNRIKKDLIYV